MDQAVAWSKRDRQDVANAKMKDWMIKSLVKSPKARREEIAPVVENPRFITWWMNNTFGRGNWDRDDWKVGVRKLRRRLAAIGFVRSGFAKAQAKLPAGDRGRPGKQKMIGGQKLYTRFARVTRARVRKAAPRQRAKATAEIEWETPRGQAALSIIVGRALTSGRRGMVQDTKQYLKRKMAKTLKRISV